MSHPPRPLFKLALAQMLVFGGKVEANLARAVRQIAAAAERGAQVVLLPEALDLGWTHPQSRAQAGEIPGGRVCEALRAAARRHRLYVCAGLTEADGGHVYNAAVLLSPDGEILLRHRKLNELAIAHEVYDQGDRLGVASTPLGTFGLLICADALVPGESVLRTLGMMGADVVLSPCAWAVPPGYDQQARPYGIEWREGYGAVAKAYRIWIAGCSNVGRISGGPWHGHACIGCSLVVGPEGEPVISGHYGEDAEEMLFIDIPPGLRPPRETGWRAG